MFLCYRGYGDVLPKETFESANNRVETYVGLRLNAHKVAEQDITDAENGWYKVQSQTIRGEYYSVNITIGFCTCPRGRDGSPCVHQAAVVIQRGVYSHNLEKVPYKILDSTPLFTNNLSKKIVPAKTWYIQKHLILEVATGT